MWGTTSENIYFVGTNGNITYYNGQFFQELRRRADAPVQDIWGAGKQDAQEYDILAPSSEKFDISEKIILEIDSESQEVRRRDWPYQERRIHSCWFKNSRLIWMCGGGVYVRKNDIWVEFTELPLIFTNRIRGNDINDIFVVGDFGITAHYNGINWKVFPEVNSPLYKSLDYKGNLMVAVGDRNGRGIILRMFR